MRQKQSWYGFWDETRPDEVGTGITCPRPCSSLIAMNWGGCNRWP